MVQVPAETSATVLPETVQRLVVAEVKVTLKPEDAVALMAKLAMPTVFGESDAKVML
jgi:hypothetical protein